VKGEQQCGGWDARCPNLLADCQFTTEDEEGLPYPPSDRSIKLSSLLRRLQKDTHEENPRILLPISFNLQANEIFNTHNTKIHHPSPIGSIEVLWIVSLTQVHTASVALKSSVCVPMVIFWFRICWSAQSFAQDSATKGESVIPNQQTCMCNLFCMLVALHCIVGEPGVAWFTELRTAARASHHSGWQGIYI